LLLAGVCYGYKRSSVDLDKESLSLDSYDYEGNKKQFLFELLNAPQTFQDRALEFFKETAKRSFLNSFWGEIRSLQASDSGETRAYAKLLMNLPWFLPRKYGGLGLEFGAPSHGDLIRSSYMFKNKIVSPDYLDKKWLFHQLAQNEVSEIIPLTEGQDPEYGALYWFVLSKYRGDVEKYDLCLSWNDREEAPSYLNRLARVAQFHIKLVKKFRRERRSLGHFVAYPLNLLRKLTVKQGHHCNGEAHLTVRVVLTEEQLVEGFLN